MTITSHLRFIWGGGYFVLFFFSKSLNKKKSSAFSVYRSIFFFFFFCGVFTVRADHCRCPALSCSVEPSCISRFLWFSVGRIGPCSGSPSHSGLYSSSLFCDGGVHEGFSATSIFRIFSRSLRFHRSNVLEIVNTVNERVGGVCILVISVDVRP